MREQGWRKSFGMSRIPPVLLVDLLQGVSVIIPCHNSERTITKTLDSIRSQSLSSLEIICVDDASRDGTHSILQSFAEIDARLKIISLSENVGVHLARAEGIKQATCQWIGFLDSDDIALPGMFETLLSAAESKNADIVICGSERVTPDGRFLGDKVRFKSSLNFDDNVFQSFCRLSFGTGALWNKLYRAPLVQKWGTKKQRWMQNGTEDTLVNIGCFWEAERVVVLPEVLHQYVLQPGSITTSTDAQRSVLKIIKAFAIAIDLYASLGEEALVGITDLYRAQLDFPAYGLPWQTGYAEWLDELADPLQFLATEHPQTLALLLARLPAEDRPSVRGRLRTLWQRLSDRTRG